MNIALISAVKLGLFSINGLVESGFKPKLCITLKDNLYHKKTGRVSFDKICKKNKIILFKIKKINSDNVISTIKKNKIDILFVIGWSQIVNRKLLKSVNNYAFGIHPTLLPQGRGRAPIPWTILKGLKYSGVTLFKLNSDVDSGKIVNQIKFKLNPNEDANSLYKKICDLHKKIIKETIFDIVNKDIKLTNQDKNKITVWNKRSPADGQINLKGKVKNAERLVRSVTRPYPGAFIIYKYKRYIIWKAQIVKSLKNNNTFEFKDGYLEMIDWAEDELY